MDLGFLRLQANTTAASAAIAPAIHQIILDDLADGGVTWAVVGVGLGEGPEASSVSDATTGVAGADGSAGFSPGGVGGGG